jgi:hypothetical protein
MKAKNRKMIIVFNAMLIKDLRRFNDFLRLFLPISYLSKKSIFLLYAHKSRRFKYFKFEPSYMGYYEIV